MNTTFRLTAALAALAFLSAFAFSLAPSASAQTPPAPPTVSQHPGERHPDLRRANRDFGGHRQKAAALCYQAQQEIQMALESNRS